MIGALAAYLQLEGFLVTGTAAEEKAWAIRLLSAWCVIVFLGALLQTKLWNP